MADFSLTTIFVAPVGQTALPSSGSTQDLTAGQIGVFKSDWTLATAENIAASSYFYIAQGRTNTYLEGSKKSDKIKGCPSGTGCRSNVIEWYKVAGCPTPTNQITDIDGWDIKCGEDVTVTVRLFSSYIQTLFYNGLTRSVTVKAPCCECGASPCTATNVPNLIDAIIAKFEQHAPGLNPDNLVLTNFLDFERVGDDENAILRIHGKALTAYGVPCDVAAFPHEYDRLYFKAFVQEGPATTADFIVADACNTVATVAVTQTANYATGTAAEIKQLEKNFNSYQTIQKHLFRMAGYNQDFESWADSTVYDTYYIKFNEYNRPSQNWGDYVPEDEMMIIAIPKANAETLGAALEAVLVAALGAVSADNVCITTTTTAAPTTTTTTTAAATTTTTTTAG